MSRIKGQGSVIAMDATIEFLKNTGGEGKTHICGDLFPAPHAPHHEKPVSLPDRIQPPKEGKNSGYYREIQLIDQQLGEVDQRYVGNGHS